MGLPAQSVVRYKIIFGGDSQYGSSLHFAYFIDLSQYLATDASFKSAISQAGDIAVYDRISDTVRPRHVILDLTNNKLLVYFDAARIVNSSSIFYICTGPLNQLNSPFVWSDNNYTSFWGFDEFANGSTSIDFTRAHDLSVIAPATIGHAGKTGNSALFTEVIGRLEATSSVIPVGDISIEFIIKLISLRTGTRIIDNGKFHIRTENGGGFTIISDTGGMDSATLGDDGAALNNWVHCVVVRKANGNVLFYQNGTQRGIERPSGTPTIAGATLLWVGYGDSKPLGGYIDCLGLYSGLMAPETILQRSKMLLTPDTVWTVVKGLSKRVTISPTPENNRQIKISSSAVNNFKYMFKN